jgi:hypothetical protein
MKHAKMFESWVASEKGRLSELATEMFRLANHVRWRGLNTHAMMEFRTKHPFLKLIVPLLPEMHEVFGETFGPIFDACVRVYDRMLRPVGRVVSRAETVALRVGLQLILEGEAPALLKETLDMHAAAFGPDSVDWDTERELLRLWQEIEGIIALKRQRSVNPVFRHLFRRENQQKLRALGLSLGTFGTLS